MTAFRFYWVVTAAGAVLMALEIVSSRLLAPQFGSSVYVWGSIIGVFLAALSIGYALGGALADRVPTLAMLGRLVVFTALCQAVLLLAGEQLVARLGGWSGGSPAGTLAVTALLFGPATVLLGMVSPFAIRLAARDVTRMGHTAGRLYALSALGSLAGTLGSTFLLIPYLQLRQIFGLLLLITAATGLLALADVLRRELPAVLLAVLLAVLAASHLAPQTRFSGAIYQRITPYQTLRVVEVDGIRYLQSDGITHGAVQVEDGRPALRYIRSVPAAFLLNPEIERVLALGMGGGTVSAYLRSELPELEVEFVEIDPAVPEVGRRYFGFEEGDGVSVTIADGRRFLAAAEDRRWDLIFTDTYIGLSVPFHLTTIEFCRLVADRLEPGGVFAVNLASDLEAAFPRAIYRTMSEVFDTIYAFRSRGSGNVLLFATMDERQLTAEELAERAVALEGRLRFPDLTLPQLAALYLPVDIEILEAPVLSDRFAPVARLIAVGGRVPEEGEQPEQPELDGGPREGPP